MWWDDHSQIGTFFNTVHIVLRLILCSCLDIRDPEVHRNQITEPLMVVIRQLSTQYSTAGFYPDLGFVCLLKVHPLMGTL